MGKSKEELKKIGEKTQFKSGKEAAENGKKGGIASGEAKREKKLVKSIWTAILNSEIQDEDYIKQEIEKYPLLEKEQITNAYNFSKDIIEILRRRKEIILKDDDGQPILDSNNNKQKIVVPFYNENTRLKAYEIIMNYSGQKPVEQQIIGFDENNELIIDLGDDEEEEEEYENGDNTEQN